MFRGGGGEGRIRHYTLMFRNRSLQIQPRKEIKPKIPICNIFYRCEENAVIRWAGRGLSRSWTKTLTSWGGGWPTSEKHFPSYPSNFYSNLYMFFGYKSNKFVLRRQWLVLFWSLNRRCRCRRYRCRCRRYRCRCFCSWFTIIWRTKQKKIFLSNLMLLHRR